MSQGAIVVRLKVGKGLSVEVAKDRWRKVYYGMELDIEAANMQDVEEAKVKAEGFIDKWLEAHTGKAKVAPFVTKEDDFRPVGEIPQLDIAEVDDLPWKAKGGKPANKGGWGWIFSDTKSFLEKHAEKDQRLVSELGRAIRQMKSQHNANLQLGNMQYFYGGDGKFINRKPIKQESAR